MKKMLHSAAMVALLLSGFQTAQSQPIDNENDRRVALSDTAAPLLSDGLDSVDDQTRTRLANGDWLVTGGSKHLARVGVIKGGSQRVLVLPTLLGQPRKGHSATLLSDGTVAIYGGVGINGLILDTMELFDPETNTVTMLGSVGLLPRTSHSATLITDTKLLIAGGVDEHQQPLFTAEIFDIRSRQHTLLKVNADTGLSAPSAVLLADKSVLITNKISAKSQEKNSPAEIFRPDTVTFTEIDDRLASKLGAQLTNDDNPSVVDSDPADQSIGFISNRPLQVRFTKQMDVLSLNDQTVTLTAPDGSMVPSRVVSAEGLLLFISPKVPLADNSRYVLDLVGLTDVNGHILPDEKISFTTIKPILKTIDGLTATKPVPYVLIKAAREPVNTETFSAYKQTWERFQITFWRGKTFLRGGVIETNRSAVGTNLYAQNSCPDDDDDTSCKPAAGSNTVLKRPLLTATPAQLVRAKSATTNGTACYDEDADGDCESPGGDDGGGAPAPESNAPPKGPPPCGCQQGDPVDVYTGMFTMQKTDLKIADVSPILINRSYRNLDPAVRAFGVGTNLSYDMFLVGDPNLAFMDLVLPDGSKVHYTATTVAGALPSFAVAGTPTNYSGSTILSQNNSTNWLLQLKDGSQYQFSGGATSNPRSSALLSMTDRNGNNISLARDANYNLTLITSPNGRKITLAYDSSQRVTQATDDLGRSVQYGYDSQSRLTSVKDPIGNTESYSYDSNGNLLTITDRRNNLALTNVYDSSGRVTKQIFADNTTNSYAYTADGNGNTTQVDFTDQRGTITRTSFNSSGYPVATTYAYGTSIAQTVTLVRDSNTQRVTQRTDALNRVTSYGYDSYGNLTSMTRPDNSVISFAYESTFNQLIQRTDANGLITYYQYDSKGNISKITDPLGNITSITNDAAGRPTKISDPLGQASVIGYFGGDLSSYVDSLGRTSYILTDLIGRPTTAVNPLGGSTSTSFDLLDRVQSVSDANGNLVQFGYDANGNQISHTDGNKNTTTLGFDTLNRVTSMKDSLSNIESYAYEPGGKISQRTRRSGKIDNFSYDALGRLITAQYGQINQTTYAETIGFTYDAGNRITQFTDSLTGTISRTYDVLNRVTQETSPNGVVGYSYDRGGRRVGMTIQGQPSVSYVWDSDSRLTQIQAASGAINGSAARSVSIQYDNASRRTSIVLPNGLTKKYSYDSASEITDISYIKNDSSLLSELIYSYDLAGRQISVSGSGASINIPASVSGATYNSNNQLTQWGAVSPKYDLDGNQISDGTNSYTWDTRDRLVAVSNASKNSNYLYDAVGRRFSTTTASTTTSYVYDGQNRVIETGQSTTMYLTGQNVDEIFEQSSSGTNSDYVTDVLGSTIALNAADQSVPNSYSYEPYGKTTGSGSLPNNSKYSGREDEGDGSLYFYRNRFYSANLSRFLNEDPIGWASGQANNYAYVGGNPISATDPLGLWSFNMSLYAGLGGGITFGRDPSTGEIFYGGRLGIGFGGSLGLDTNGQRPGADQANKSGQACNNGTSYGTYYELGGAVGPYSMNLLQASGGYDTGSDTSYSNSPGVAQPVFGGYSGISVGGAFGFEIIGH